MKKPSSVTARIDRAFFVAALILTFLGSVGWLVFTAHNSDDICYLHKVPGSPTDGHDYWSVTEPAIETFSDALESVRDHYLTINGRIPNLLVILTLNFVPRPVLMVICAAMLALMSWMLFLVGRSGRRRPMVWTVAGVVMLWCVFPWHDNFQCYDYLVNYLLPSILMLAALQFCRRVRTLRHFVWLSLLLLFMGLCHEGFAVVTGTYFAIMVLLRPKRRKLYLLLVAVCILSVGFTLISGTARRVETVDMSAASFEGVAFHFLVGSWPLFLSAVVITVTAAILHARRRKTFLRLTLPMWFAAIIWVLPAAVLSREVRSLWPSYILAVVIMLLAVDYGLRPRRVRPAGLSFAGLFLLAYAVWLASLALAANLSGRRMQAFLNVLDTTRSNVVFADLIQNDNLPFWLMEMTGEGDPLSGVNFRYAGHAGLNPPVVLILPASLEGTDFDDWPAASADGEIRGVWPMYSMRRRPPVVHRPAAETVPVTVIGEGYPPLTHRNPLSVLFEKVSRHIGINVDSIDRCDVMYPVVYRGDSIYLMHFSPLPRSRTGRLRYRIELRQPSESEMPFYEP